MLLAVTGNYSADIKTCDKYSFATIKQVELDKKNTLMVTIAITNSFRKSHFSFPF